MSVNPQIVSSHPAPPSPPRTFVRWHQRILGFCFVIFALELGIFLLIFPWLKSWDLNWVPLQSANLRLLWMSPYFRGALSGLGLVNLYIGISELLRQTRSLFQR
jgi:hypothetical protein